nr:hypothetical protein [Tanacetum cinerariifolium]
MGITLDKRYSAKGSEVYTFRVQGGIYHKIDQLVPRDREPRKEHTDMNAEKIAEQHQGMSKYFLFEDNELTLIEDYDDIHVYNEDTYGPTYAVSPHRIAQALYYQGLINKKFSVGGDRLLARLFLLVDFKEDDVIGGNQLLARLFLLVDFKEDDVIGGDRFLARLFMLVNFEKDDVIGGNQLLARLFFMMMIKKQQQDFNNKKKRTSNDIKGRIEAVDSNGHLRSCPSDLGGIVRGRGNRSFGRLAGSHRIRVGSWNETKWNGSRAREGNGYKLWYSRSSIARNDVGIILARRHKDNVVRVTRRGDRIMAISIVIEGETVNIINTYALQVRLSDADKKRFWDALDEMVRECPTNQCLIIGGDLNGHIGAAVDGYAEVHGGFGFGYRNEEGLIIVDVLLERLRHRREATGRPRILWKNLNGEAVETFRATVFERLMVEDMSASNADQMWNTLSCVMKDA